MLNFKHYFTDGLVQIAIVLSLLRTDLNTYFDHNYVNYPEVQEIVLGPSALLTQTNFHNNPYMNSQFGYQEIYRKHYDTDHIYSSSLFRDLSSLRHLSSDRRSQDITTFLMVGEPSGTVVQEPTDASGGGDLNNNIESQHALSEELQIEGQNLLTSLEESIEAIAPFLQNLGADPTREDLDLIEVLWRQDIDLGAGKEVFDPNLRRELEREREVELQKERQTQKEKDLLEQKLKEQQSQNEQRWLAENFTQDGETGEWVPLGGRHPPPPADISVVPDGDQFTFDNIPSLSDELQQQQQQQQQQQNANYNMTPQQGTMNMLPQHQQFQGQQAMQGSPPLQPMLNNNSQAPPMYNQNQTQSQFGQGSVDVVYHRQAGYNVNNLPAIEMNNTQVFGQPQTGFNNTHVPQVPTMYNQSQVFNNQMNANFPRSTSLEQTWQDLVNLLDLPQNQSQANNVLNNLTSGGLLPDPVSPLDNASSVLIQNATMPTPAPINSNITGFDSTGLLPQNNTDLMRSPAHSSGMVSPGQSFNATVPTGGALSPLEWDPCSNFLFPNVTGNLNQSDVLPEDVDKLLPDLMAEDELENINFADMGLSDAMTPTPTRDVADTSSDSAVSMGSPSMGSPEQNDFSDGAFSPYDGLEGATGGHEDSSRIPKTLKYDPDDFQYGQSCSYSGGDSNSSNFSSTSNDTNGGHSHFSRGGHFGPPSNGHINHNHTYPMKPGADPKDIKRHVYKDEKPRHKGPHSRDRKRLAEMNIPFSLEQVVDTPVEEFNDMLTQHKFTDVQLQLIRDIRRRGKNKVAAQHCRKRKMDVIDTLEDDLTSLEKMRDKLLHERHMIDKQTREMKEKFGLLYSEIFHSLRDEHGRPYDPSRFSLQQSADGDVFLVPRNYTMEDDYNKRRKGEQE